MNKAYSLQSMNRILSLGGMTETSKGIELIISRILYFIFYTASERKP